ncbi:MAG: hypothetical protein E2O80_03340 [Betaproteobacteria bacterium]|nr:MAG: hypothetical protein E2O80_03340 [Betaproteobacteria bacterium]
MSAIKLFLYLTATVIVMALLYVGFVYAIVDQTTLRQETFDNCMKVFGINSFSYFDLCLKQRAGITIPIWLYIAPYLPAGLLWWLSRSLNINLHLSVETYPKRTVIVLVWLGLIAAAYAIIITLWIAMNLVDEPPRIAFMPTIILSGWLIAPLLFQHLLAPAEAVRHMSALKIGLVTMFVTPVITVVFSFLKIEGIFS